MTAEFVDDLLGVLELSGDDIGVIQDPVQFFAVAVFIAQDLQGAVHKPDHLIAPLNAAGMLFDFGSG